MPRARLRVRRVYAPLAGDDGTRVLVDRLWPRGVAKAKLPGVVWLKDIAPGDALRHWFAHDATRWKAFRTRYFAELDANPAAVAALRALLRAGPATLLYAARDEAHNNAVALRDYLVERDGKSP